MKRALPILFAATLAAGAASAQEPAEIRVSTIPIVDTAPLQAAIAKGYFEDMGLKVNTTPTAGGAVGLPALAAGQVQIAFSNSVSIALGAARGLGFRVVGAGSFTGEETPDLAAIVAAPDAGIETGADLEGKRLAVNTRANVIWLYANAWIDETGGDPEAVTYIEVPFPQMIDAVRGGRVDAAFVVDPFLTAGLDSGAVELVGWPYNAVQTNIPIGMYATTGEYLDENPEVIGNFVTAYNRGVDWMNENVGTEEWAEIISGYTRLPPETLAGLNIPPFEKTIDPAALQPTFELMVTYGLLDAAPSAEEILVDAVKAE